MLSTDATVSVTTATAPPVTTTTAPPGGGATTPSATGTTSAPPAPATPTGTTTAPADGGASPVAPTVPGGDEEGVRVPAAFTVSAGGVTPTQVTVPPFLRVELTLRSGDGDAHRVTLRTRAPASYDVPAGGTATQLADGLPAGTYAILVDGRESGGSLRVADEAGP